MPNTKNLLSGEFDDLRTQPADHRKCCPTRKTRTGNSRSVKVSGRIHVASILRRERPPFANLRLIPFFVGAGRASQGARDPSLDLGAITQVYDVQVGSLRRESCYAFPRLAVGAPCPTNDVVSVAKDCPQRRLDIGVPENLSTQSAANVRRVTCHITCVRRKSSQTSRSARSASSGRTVEYCHSVTHCGDCAKRLTSASKVGRLVQPGP